MEPDRKGSVMEERMVPLERLSPNGSDGAGGNSTDFEKG